MALSVSRWPLVVLALLTLAPPAVRAGGPAAAKAKALQDEAMTLYKQKDFRGARDRLVQAHQLAPNNHELLRLIGQCHAMKGEREKAYDSYRQYVQRCPKCMYAPQLREAIHQYEKETERAEGSQEPPREEPGPSPRGEDDLARQAQARYEEAYVLKDTNPELAREKLEQVLRLVPEGHIYHTKARKLLERIRSGAF